MEVGESTKQERKERLQQAEQLTEGIADAAEQRRRRFVPKGAEWKDARFNLELGYSFWLNSVPVRVFPGCGLPNTLSFADCGRLYRCALMMQAKTNMLYYHSHGIDKPMTMERLARELQTSTRVCYRFIQRMIDLRIMAREEGRLYMNPCYFFRGKHLSYHLYRMFEQDLEGVLPEWVVDRYNGDIHA